MKKYLALVSLSALLILSGRQIFADAQGGNTASGAPEGPNGITLNNKVAPSATQMATIAANTAASGYVFPIVSGSGTPVAGSVVISGSDVKIYLTGSTGILLTSGSTAVRTF